MKEGKSARVGVGSRIGRVRTTALFVLFVPQHYEQRFWVGSLDRLIAFVHVLVVRCSDFPWYSGLQRFCLVQCSGRAVYCISSCPLVFLGISLVPLVSLLVEADAYCRSCVDRLVLVWLVDVTVLSLQKKSLSLILKNCVP